MPLPLRRSGTGDRVRRPRGLRDMRVLPSAWRGLRVPQAPTSVDRSRAAVSPSQPGDLPAPSPRTSASASTSARQSTRGTFRQSGLLATVAVWIAMTGISWTLAERHADRVEHEAESAALARAAVTAGAVEQALVRTLEAAETLHALMQVRLTLSHTADATSVAEIEEQLRTVARRAKFGVLQVATIGPGGLLSWSSVPDWSPIYLGDREHFRVHREGRQDLFVSAPLVGRASGQWSVQLTKPLWEPSGRFAGVAVVSVDPRRLSRELAALNFGEESSITVLRTDGTVVAHSDTNREQLGRLLPSDSQIMTALGAAQNGSLRVTEGTLGESARLVGYSVLPNSQLAVTVSLSAEREVERVSFVRPALRVTAAAYSAALIALLGVGLMWLERRRALIDLQGAQSEREEAIEQLVRAQQVEALGRLAGGMAHDFNNVLQTVLSGASIIERRASEPDAVRRWARVVTEAADRGSAVTRRLLEHVRQRDLRPEPIDVQQLLDGLCEVLTHTLGRQVKVHVDAQPGLPPVAADRRQLETVLVNLAINARDAVSAGSGCTITFQAAAEPPEGGGAAGWDPDGHLPGRVRLTVQDDGPGMPPEVLSRATEPFFTTKASGTGLGLALARSFADRSGGDLTICSEPGRGTAVSVFLPIARRPPGIRSGPVRERFRDHRTGILLVDDEVGVRTGLAMALRDWGHSVTEVGCGREALGWLDRGSAVDALVTDLAMPEMDGLTLVQEARRRRPGLPALLVTGHAGMADEAAMEAARSGGPFRILHKPVSPDVLADELTELLSSDSEQGDR